MSWTIQDAFHKCGKDMHLLANRMKAKQRVHEVAHSIRNLGYTVQCGWWKDRGYAGSPEANWEHPEDKRLATKAWNYVISSIRRPSGEYVYGSAEPPLDEKGIEVELIDLRTLNPLDYDSIYSSIKKTGKIIIVHEAYTTCGVGAEIVARVTENCLSSLVIPPLRIGAIDTPIPASPVLEDHNIPAAENIFKNICEHIGKHY